MKRDNKKEVMNALIMVFQFGINMIVPIFLCTLAGVWIGKKTGDRKSTRLNSSHSV